MVTGRDASIAQQGSVVRESGFLSRIGVKFDAEINIKDYVKEIYKLADKYPGYKELKDYAVKQLYAYVPSYVVDATGVALEAIGLSVPLKADDVQMAGLEARLAKVEEMSRSGASPKGSAPVGSLTVGEQRQAQQGAQVKSAGFFSGLGSAFEPGIALADFVRALYKWGEKNDVQTKFVEAAFESLEKLVPGGKLVAEA